MELPPSLLLPHVDELVMEYLLFRGFTKSFQVFSAERKRDRAKGFDVEQIIAQLLSYVQTYQIDALLETWKFLAARFFNHLDASYAETIHSLETSLLRLYVVNAIKTGQREHAVEFFQSFISSPRMSHANKLNATLSSTSDAATASDSWCRWFILPFIQQPESDAYFQVFFSADWLDAFVASLRNFFTLIFRNVALPKLLAFQLTRLEEPALKMRLRMSQSECNRLRLFNVDANARIKKLEGAGQQLHSLLRRMVQHSYAEHFARGGAPSVGAVFSPQQLQELGELFGIHSSSNDSSSSPDALGAPDPSRDRVSQSELASGADDALACDGALSPRPSPPVTTPSGHCAALAALSLVRRLDCASGAAPSTSVERLAVGSAAALASYASAAVAPALCRIAPDGTSVAHAVLGDRAITIWSTQASACDADGDVAAPVASTPLRLVSPLATLSWIAPGASERDGGSGDDQLLLYGLADGTLNLWSMCEAKRVAQIQCDSGMTPSLLVAASQAPLCLLLTTTQAPLANGSATDPLPRARQLLQLIRARSASASPELVRQTVWRCSDDVTCIACDGTASVFATSSRAGTIEVYDSKLRHPVLSWHAAAPARRRTPDASDSAGDPIRALALAPDGLSILSLSTAPSSATSAVITEWACAGDSIASARDGACNDSSEDDAELRAATSAPPIRCTYALACPDSLDNSSDCESLQYKLQFDATGQQFVVTTHADARLVSVHVFQRGDPQAHALDFRSSISSPPSSPTAEQPAMLVAFDWTATATPPLCSTWSSDSELSLWRLEERVES